MCAYKLGIPVNKVSVKPSNNLIAPNASLTGGSLTSEAVCWVSRRMFVSKTDYNKTSALQRLAWAKVASRINLLLRYSRIRVKRRDFYFQGIIQACDILLERIKPVRDKMNHPTWEELVKECHKQLVNLCATSM